MKSVIETDIMAYILYYRYYNALMIGEVGWCDQNQQ